METVALLQDLIRQINDPTLRDRILQETDKLMKQKKFGLVFEEHLPNARHFMMFQSVSVQKWR